MKVAVTDYDGTLCRKGVVQPEALAAIEDWRRAGNVFGIATGRDLSMILHETDKWGIDFDFLACANGAVLYDQDRTVLHSVDMDEELPGLLLGHSAVRASMHVEMCSQGVVYLCAATAVSWFPELGVPFVRINIREALKIRPVQQFCLAYLKSEEAGVYSRMLNEDFQGRLQAHRNGGCIDITGHGVDKATGVLEVLRIKGWPEKDLLAIGDGMNDLAMIRRFRGFTVTGAKEGVIREATAVYNSVGDMLREHGGKG